jgi:hypothetical protein
MLKRAKEFSELAADSQNVKLQDDLEDKLAEFEDVLYAICTRSLAAVEEEPVQPSSSVSTLPIKTAKSQPLTQITPPRQTRPAQPSPRTLSPSAAQPFQPPPTSPTPVQPPQPPQPIQSTPPPQSPTQPQTAKETGTVYQRSNPRTPPPTASPIRGPVGDIAVM